MIRLTNNKQRTIYHMVKDSDNNGVCVTTLTPSERDVADYLVESGVLRTEYGCWSGELYYYVVPV